MDTFIIPVDDRIASVLGKALKLDGFFPEFKAEHVTHLFPKSRLTRYPPGVHIIEQGDSGRDLFVICLGQVAVSQVFGAAGAALGELKEGDIFGEIGLIRDGLRTATVITSVESQVFRLAFEDLTYLLTHNSALANHLKSLAQKRTS